MKPAVVGPELILPSEWLPVIWGGEEPEFETEDEMRTVLGTIMGRYNEIVACLDTDPDDFDPIFLEGPEGEVIASDWAGGFLDAVALRPMAWKSLIESDDAGILMAPLFLLNGDLEIEPPRCLVWVATASRGADLVFLGSAESRFSAPA